MKKYSLRSRVSKCIFKRWKGTRRNFLLFNIFFLLIFFSLKAQTKIDSVQTGIASYYGVGFDGRYCASGEIFHKDSLTAASKNLPFGTWWRVTNLSNDSVVIIKVNDRMPQSNPRLIDLSEGAAKKLDMIKSGTTMVKIEMIVPRKIIFDSSLIKALEIIYDFQNKDDAKLSKAISTSDKKIKVVTMQQHIFNSDSLLQTITSAKNKLIADSLHQIVHELNGLYYSFIRKVDSVANGNDVDMSAFNILKTDSLGSKIYSTTLQWNTFHKRNFSEIVNDEKTESEEDWLEMVFKDVPCIAVNSFMEHELRTVNSMEFSALCKLKN